MLGTFSPTVSVDVEMSLANTTTDIFTEYNDRHGTDYDLEDQTDWEWVGRELGYDEFMSIGHEIWAEEHLGIEPLTDDLAESIEWLNRYATIDIVTARQNVEDEMREWLNFHNILDYRLFRSVSNDISKAELGYDFYIDDKPALVHRISSSQKLYLVRQPYNRKLWDTEFENVIVVEDVSEAVDLLIRELKIELYP